MKLPRLTVRRLMVVVAVAAVVLWVESWHRRYAYCERNLARCASAEEFHLWMAAGHERITALYRKLAAGERGSVRYNTEQAAIFARAARDEQAEAKMAADRGKAFRRASIYPRNDPRSRPARARPDKERAEARRRCKGQPDCIGLGKGGGNGRLGP
jgi:hypothetical protein